MWRILYLVRFALYPLENGPRASIPARTKKDAALSSAPDGVDRDDMRPASGRMSWGVSAGGTAMDRKGDERGTRRARGPPTTRLGAALCGPTTPPTGRDDLDLTIGGRGEDPLDDGLPAAHARIIGLQLLDTGLQVEDAADALEVDALLGQGLNAAQTLDVAVGVAPAPPAGPGGG